MQRGRMKEAMEVAQRKAGLAAQAVGRLAIELHLDAEVGATHSSVVRVVVGYFVVNGGFLWCGCLVVVWLLPLASLASPFFRAV